MLESKLKRHVLVLNQNYEPMSVCDVRRAIILIYLGKAEIIERDSGFVRSVSVSIPFPLVVRIVVYVRIPSKRIILSRKNIIKRDGCICQYCGAQNVPMTVDHVIPKNLGGNDSWENLVCACVECNNKKSNRTAEQVSMRLIRRPRKPNHLTFIQHFVGVRNKKWKPYLFMN